MHGTIIRCANCEIIYVAETISQTKIIKNYESSHDIIYFQEQEARKKTFSRYAKNIANITKIKGKLLDVGTNTGLFVKIVKDLGWDANGLEPSKSSVEFANKHYGLKLIAKSFEKGIFKKELFSVITMWDVIEHFNDPVLEMEKVFHYLKPGGVFVFSTVDPSSFLAKLMGTHWSWYMEMHRTLLNRSSAKYYLQKTGFTKIIFKPHFRYLSLGYLSTRLAAVHPFVAFLSGKIFNIFGLSKMIIPIYANDLYDCYAFKKYN